MTGIVDNWPDKLLKHRRSFTGKVSCKLKEMFGKNKKVLQAKLGSV